MFFGHPLVPAVEHLQPFCLPLSQHLSGDFFSTVVIGDNDKRQTISVHSYTVLCHFPVLMKGKSCHQRGRDGGSSLPCPNRKSTSDKTVEHLPLAANYKENRKLTENFPPVQFPTTSYTNQYLTSLPSYWRSELPFGYTQISCADPEPKPGLLNKQNITHLRSWLTCLCIQQLKKDITMTWMN